jgi:hypothetical protein
MVISSEGQKRGGTSCAWFNISSIFGFSLALHWHDFARMRSVGTMLVLYLLWFIVVMLNIYQCEAFGCFVVEK